MSTQKLGLLLTGSSFLPLRYAYLLYKKYRLESSEQEDNTMLGSTIVLAATGISCLVGGIVLLTGIGENKAHAQHINYDSVSEGEAIGDTPA